MRMMRKMIVCLVCYFFDKALWPDKSFMLRA
jgi:hypothetical protein